MNPRWPILAQLFLTIIAVTFAIAVWHRAATVRCAIQPEPETFSHVSIFVTPKGTLCWYGDKSWISPDSEMCSAKDAPKP